MDSVVTVDKTLQLTPEPISKIMILFFMITYKWSSGSSHLFLMKLHLYVVIVTCLVCRQSAQIFLANRLDWITQSLHFSVSSVKLSLRWESTCRNTLPVPGTVSLRGERCMSNDSITELTQWKWAPSDRQAAESLKPAWLPLLLAFMISRFRVGSTTQFHLITVVKRTVRAVHDGAD